MRVVLAHHTIRVEELERHQQLPGRADDEILCLGGPYTHLTYQPENYTYSEIAKQFPDGWKPDVYIHWSMEYYRIPAGLEEADCFLVGAVGDTFLGGRAVQAMGGAFDLLLIERSGIDGLRRVGFTNLHVSNFFGFDPILHRRLEGVERDLDIVMIGNFNHDVQHERSRWLARVARLSRHYRVCLTTDVWGEEYTQLMNRARIVFNRSISGVINMRVYEAAACGACLFYERENLEIRDLFTDRQECVLYSEEDLEDLLHYYLTHEEERQEIARRAHQKVQSYSYAHQIGRILTDIDKLRHEIPLYRNRSYRKLPDTEKQKRLAVQWMITSETKGLIAADNMFIGLQDRTPEDPIVFQMRGCLFGEWAHRLQDTTQKSLYRSQAIQLIRRSLELNSQSPVAYLNLSHLYRENADTPSALQSIQAALQLLYSHTLSPSDLAGPYYPHRFDYYDMELERVYSHHAEGSDLWQKHIREVLQWNAWSLLSALLLEIGRFEEAKEAAMYAVRLRPEWGLTRGLLAKSLAGAGEIDRSLEEYRVAIKQAPFEVRLWLEYIELLTRNQRLGECRAFIEDCLLIVNGSPPYAWIKDLLEKELARISPTQREEDTRNYLAVVDWNNPDEWQTVIRFWSHTPSTETGLRLTLTLDPAIHPDLETIVHRLERYVSNALMSSLDTLHDIVLSETSLTRESVLQLISQSHVVLSTPMLHRLVDQSDLSKPGLLLRSLENVRPLQKTSI